MNFPQPMFFLVILSSLIVVLSAKLVLSLTNLTSDGYCLRV